MRIHQGNPPEKARGELRRAPDGETGAGNAPACAGRQFAATLQSTMGGMGGVRSVLRVTFCVSHTVSWSAFGQMGSDGCVPANLTSYSTSEYGLPSVKSGFRDCGHLPG